MGSRTRVQNDGVPCTPHPFDAWVEEPTLRAENRGQRIGDEQEREEHAICAYRSSPPSPSAAVRRVVGGEVEPGVDAELGPGPAVVGAGGLQLRGLRDLGGSREIAALRSH